MTTFLDLLGLGFRPRIVFDTGGDGGGGGSSGSDDDRSGGTSAADAYQQYADTMAEAGVLNLAGAGTSAYEQAQALAGRDDDDEPSFPFVIGDTIGSETSNVVSGPAGIDFSVPDEFYRDVMGFDIADNQPSGMFQGPTLDLDPIVSTGTGQVTIDPVTGNIVEYGADIDPLGLDSVGAFTPIDVPEISDINLEFGGVSPADTRPVADTKSFTTFDDLMGGGDDLVDVGGVVIEDTDFPSVTDPDRTGLEDFAYQQYLNYAPGTVDDFEVGLSPQEMSSILNKFSQYYESDSPRSPDPANVMRIPISDPQAPAPQVAPSGPKADELSMIDPMDPNNATILPTDAPVIVDGELITPSSIGGAGTAPVEVQQPVDIPDYEGVDQDAINKLVAGVLTGTPVEGADVITSKIGMPRDGLEGILGNALGSTLGILGMDAMFPGIGAVLSLAAIFDPQKRQEIADMLSSGEGSAVYDSQGRLLGVTNKGTGKYTGYPSDDGGFIYDDDGNLIRSSAGVPKRPVLNLSDDDDDGGDDGCPSGFVRNPVTGVCEPIDDDVGEAPPISVAPRLVRPRDPNPVRPDPVDPGDGMVIRQPTFATGGIVGYQQGGDVDAESYDFSPFQETGFGIGDTTAMLRHKVGLDTFDDNQMNMYDLNNDGMVDQTDIDAGMGFIVNDPNVNVMQHVQKRAIRERDPNPIRSKDPVGDPVLTSPAAPVEGMSIRSVGFQEGGPVTRNIDNFLRTFRG